MFGFKKKAKIPEEIKVCNHVLEENKPILYIKREMNGEYHFYCEEKNHDISELKNVDKETVLGIDNSLNKVFPLMLGQDRKRELGKEKKGLELKTFIKESIKKEIEKDIEDNQVELKNLYNNGEIYYENGRNGTWFDWQVNNKTSEFCVCYNDKKRMGYISVNINKEGELTGYKWLDYGKSEGKKINLGKLNEDDTNYLVRLLIQHCDDSGIFDTSIDNIDWESEVFVEDLVPKEDE